MSKPLIILFFWDFLVRWRTKPVKVSTLPERVCFKPNLQLLLLRCIRFSHAFLINECTTLKDRSHLVREFDQTVTELSRSFFRPNPQIPPILYFGSTPKGTRVWSWTHQTCKTVTISSYVTRKDRQTSLYVFLFLPIPNFPQSSVTVFISVWEMSWKVTIMSTYTVVLWH